jgi:hypothetical protein
MSAPATSDFLDEVIDKDGVVEAEHLSGILRVTKGELAHAGGLPRESVSKLARMKTMNTQTRLRQVTEIINRITPWCGSVQQAFAWYRSQPIPSFGDQTAEDLVRAGRADHVPGYLSRIAVGGYA